MATRKRLGFLDGLKSAAVQEEKRQDETVQGRKQEEEEAPEGGASETSFLEHRSKRLASSRKTKPLEMVPVRRVDPKRCQIREGHNRRYDLLDEVRCKDLIDNIRAQGQQIAAIVREVEDDFYYYEVIAGARRKWVAEYLDKELLVEIRTMTDQEAFELADAENRTREDISDYERALEYQRALELYYSSQRQMAVVMEVSEGWLSTYLQMARLPSEIVSAFPSILDLKIEYAKKLGPLLKKPNIRKVLLERAQELTGQGYSAVRVMKELLAVGSSKPKRGGVLVDEEYTDESGKSLFRATRAARGGFKIEFEKSLTAPREEIESAVLEALAKHLFQKG